MSGVHFEYMVVRLIERWTAGLTYMSHGERYCYRLRAEGFIRACDMLKEVVEAERAKLLGPVRASVDAIIDAVSYLPLERRYLDQLPEANKLNDYIVRAEIKMAADAAIAEMDAMGIR